MTDIEIRIDRLILRDVPPEYVDGVAAALEHEIEQAARGTDLGPVPLGERDALARQIGQQIWRSVSGGIR